MKEVRIDFEEFDGDVDALISNSSDGDKDLLRMVSADGSDDVRIELCEVFMWRWISSIWIMRRV